MYTDLGVGRNGIEGFKIAIHEKSSALTTTFIWSPSEVLGG